MNANANANTNAFLKKMQPVDFPIDVTKFVAYTPTFGEPRLRPTYMNSNSCVDVIMPANEIRTIIENTFQRFGINKFEFNDTYYSYELEDNQSGYMYVRIFRDITDQIKTIEVEVKRHYGTVFYECKDALLDIFRNINL